MMKSILSLQKAVHKIFQERAKKIDTPGVFWQQFVPYQIIGSETSSTVLLKLIQIPSNFRTSEEIIQKVKINFRNLIHQVDFILVERNFEYSSYLLVSDENLVSVESYVQIKNKSKQLIQEKVIQKYIQFASQLEAHQLSKNISFSINQIGMTKSGKFLLTNYKTYFIQENKKEENNVNKDIRYVLFRLLLPYQQKIDLSQLYSHVQENYNKNILEIVEKCLSYPQFKASDIMSTEIIQADGNLMETTLTDSFHSSAFAVSDIENVTAQTSDLSEGLLVNTTAKFPSKNRFRKIAIFAIIFIIILLALGAVTFKYLNPRPLSCQDSEYIDKTQNRCLSCDKSCDTCSDGTNISCLSCKDGLYLVKKERSEKVGKCSLSCSGTKLKSNVCIDNI